MNHPWHQSAWKPINTARNHNHLPHALLFSGEDGCGHDSFVLELSRGLLCLRPDEQGMACGHCRSCQVYASRAHPDFMLISTPEDKHIIGVDQIRTLKHFLELSCSYSACRVAVILLAENMNVNAANSLLKSLEEPSDHTHLLLYTQHPAGLLPTIRSRCQHLRLLLPAREEAIHWLRQQNPVQPPETLLTLAGGKPLLALEQDSGEKLAQHLLFINHINGILTGSSSMTEISAHWEKYPKVELLDWQLAWLHALLKKHYTQADDSALLADLVVPLNTIAHLLGRQALWGVYDRLLELKQLAAHPLNARLFVENMLSLWSFARK